ncbi:MAG TPA: FtsQ-type POTRA domain-containing protein [Candidatus Limnocylindria bacterium]|nr:FtsQ-type POTRA domain-containing protein [Candidatus Limnocylindria bacterium]
MAAAMGAAGAVGRTGAIRRLRWSGRIVTPARAAGLLGMLACGFALTFVTGPSAFGLSRTEVPALTWTDPQLVRDTLALTEGGNVFRLDTSPLAAALGSLPAVAAAEVSVSLPDAAVVVTIQERQPVLAWQVGEKHYIADRDGVIFAETDDATNLPPGVAVVDDRRTYGTAELAIGGRLDAVDLDVATRLGSVSPADIGSGAPGLQVAATDLDGFIVSVKGGWTAVFGFYSPATRPTSMIPGQVRLLRSLLAGREGAVARIILASETGGTYVPRATPKATTR